MTTMFIGDMMTSSVLPTNKQWSIDNNNTAVVSAPQKKKRRQRSGGAIEDCFTCRARATKCDRKRPYCTQCIEIGKECSGYRTTLTWGVGVASRGKLRGLSCPVANKNVDGSDISHVESVDSPPKRRRTSSAVTIKKEDYPTDAPEHSQEDEESDSHSTSTYMNPPSQTYTHGQPIVAATGFHDHVQSLGSSGGRHVSLNHPTLQHLDNSVNRYDGIELPGTTRSVGSYSEPTFYSPMDYAHTTTSLPFYESLPSTTSNVYPEQPLTTTSTDNFDISATAMGTFNYPVNQGPGYVHGAQSLTQSSTASIELVAAGTFDDPQYNPLLLAYGPYTTATVQADSHETGSERRDVQSIDVRFSSPFSHISPRLQSWMEYYDRNICTYLVAFDGPENPYRKHVLQLAINNEALQNAIAALATNNLRMRRKELRRFGFADEITDAFRGTPSRDLNEPSAEESCYKQLSIDHLNTQLTDRRAAQDDSVLATLLVLCMFHVCDSGFSKFKTQLAGVQKLLAFRDPNTQSDFTRWIQMFFTWFDVMTSAVNDREMQIRGDSMAMLDFSSNLGAMEQFSGCDGKLFKLIARLGRLNLLSQGRPVRPQDGSPQLQRSTYVRRRSHSLKQRMSNKSLSAADYANLDGNGWGTAIVSSEDEDIVAWQHENCLPSDDRDEFWAEWHDIRSRLQSFQMDLPNIPSATSPNVPTDPTMLEAGQRDMIHINESFRCAALLYTERLGHPLRPSSHHSFQRLVSEALYHITALAVDSCVNKFLLWPLFIIGTECVDERHRDLIRRRCVEVQKESGFYNNISSLEVLEKVWMEASSGEYSSEADEIRSRRRDSENGRSGRYGQAFRWRKAMDRVDGEYIVV